MICSFCKSEIPDFCPFNFCPTCGQTIESREPAPVAAKKGKAAANGN